MAIKIFSYAETTRTEALEQYLGELETKMKGKVLSVVLKDGWWRVFMRVPRS